MQISDLSLSMSSYMPEKKITKQNSGKHIKIKPTYKIPIPYSPDKDSYQNIQTKLHATSPI